MFLRRENETHNFEQMVGKLDNLLGRDDVIRATVNSRKQGEFRGNPMQALSLRQKLILLPILLTNMRQMRKSYDHLNVVPKKNQLTTDELDLIKQRARELGALSIGFAKVEQEDIFEGYGILYPYAIVFSIEMDRVKIHKAPSFDTLVTVQESYAETAIVANQLTEIIRALGFGAHAGPGLGGLTIYPVLAERAGIGAFGRHGLIISPEAGPRHRLAVVYTNIENLPVGGENEHKWIEEFCAKCGRCIKKCPVGAIHEAPVITKGENIEYIDNDVCVDYFAANYGCSICVKECPFNELGFAKVREGYASAS